jgi:hypothetical protein
MLTGAIDHILAIGGLMQVLGYAARIWAHFSTDSIPPYIMQSCLIILAPVLYAASVYMCLSRIIRSSGGDGLSLVRGRWITRVFVLADL